MNIMCTGNQFLTREFRSGVGGSRLESHCPAASWVTTPEPHDGFITRGHAEEVIYILRSCVGSSSRPGAPIPIETDLNVDVILAIVTMET